MDFDDTIFYPSAMWDIDSVYPKIESAYTIKPHMNKVFVNEFKSQTFNQDGNDSTIMKVIYYNPPNLIFQHLSIKETVETIAVNKMRNRYIIDMLTLVDICEIFKMGGKVIKIYKGVI